MSTDQQLSGSFRIRSTLMAMALLPGLTATAAGQAMAGVQFENCVHGSGGSITCDTVPTGDTLMNDVEARYGWLQNASPGWSEFDPYQGYEDDFGDNQP